MSNILTNNINPRSGNTITIGGVNDIVSIAGSISYDDVTSIDSIGIVTARGGLNVGPLTGVACTISTAGVITAEGNIDSNDILATTGGARLSADGGVYIRPADSRPATATALEIYSGGSSGSDATVNFKKNGTAFFLGAVGVGTNTSPSTYSSAADNLLVWGSGDSGITIRSGSGDEGGIYFNDTDDGNQRGIIRYIHGGDGTDNMAFHTSGGEALRILADGDILINTSTSRFGFFNDTNAPPTIQLEGSTYYDTAMSITRTDNGGSPSNFILAKTRGGNILQDNDIMGTLSFQGDDGSTALVEGARIRSEVDGTPTTDQLPSNLIFYTNGGGAATTERMRLNSSGKVLIGLTANLGSDILQLQGNTSNSGGGASMDLRRGEAAADMSSGDFVGSVEFMDNASARFARIIGRTDNTTGGVNGNPGRLEFYTENVGSDSGPVERMRIDSSGNVGINATILSGLLTLNKGNVTNAGKWSDSCIALHNPTNIGAYSQIGFGYAYSGSAETYASAYMGYVSTNQGSKGYGDLVFGTRNVNTDTQPTERMRIDNGGDVHIGNTTSSAHTNRLLAVGNVSRGATYIECRTSDSGDGGYLFSDGTGGTSEGYRGSMEYSHSVDKLFFKTAGTNQFTIESDGGIFFHNLLASAASGSSVKYSNSDDELRYDSSSQLLKTNIADLTKGIDTVKKLRPISFTSQYYNKDGSITVNDGDNCIGFLADEMVNEVPEIVNMYPKSSLTKQEEDTELVPAAIAYDKLTPVLTKALQEAITKIETLEQRLTDAGL